MGKIIAIIEKSEDGGYGIHTPSVNGLFGYGLTEDEAKESLQEALDSQLEYFDETGKEIPEPLTGEITFEYKYDLSAFFKSFPFWSVRGLSGGQSNGFCVKSAILSNIHPKTSEKPLIKPGLYQ